MQDAVDIITIVSIKGLASGTASGSLYDQSLPLTAAEALKLPDGPAVYVLWRGTVPVFAGFVDRFTQSLSRRILGHAHADGEDSVTGATHFSYELTHRPLTRLRVVKGALDARNLVETRLSGLADLPARERPDPLFMEVTLPPAARHEGA